MNTHPKTILVVGVDATITHHIALGLAERGHHVIATAQSTEALESVQKDADAKRLSLTLRQLDVRDRGKVDALAAELTIDVLLNGITSGNTGPLVEEPMDRVRQHYDLDVFGTLNVVQAFSAQMIRRKSGRIVFLSSMIGLSLPLFFNSFASTKLVIESFAGSLRNELKYFNVDIVVLNPGRINDGDTARIAAGKYEWVTETSPFFPLIEEMKRHDKVLLDNAGSVESVVRTAIAAVEARKPRIRYASPGYYNISLFLLRLMPTRLQDWSFFKSNRMKTFK